MQPSTKHVAVIIGASRGIGRQLSIDFAKEGYSVVVAAKSEQSTDRLPGSIHSVSDEINAAGGHAVPVRCDVRSPADIDGLVAQTISTFGRIDVLVYNAGSIMWKKVVETPLKRFDLMHEVNARGAYIAVQAVLPHMLKANVGRIILVAPPIYSRFFKGKTPYAMSKVAMSVLTMGLANELHGSGVSVNAIWPATGIMSQVAVSRGMNDLSLWRTPAIFSDACVSLAKEPATFSGHLLIDEDYLRTTGVTDFRSCLLFLSLFCFGRLS
eukprot:TRINITY_DN3352_c0_g1_i1.p1 TRINITY_DN3352_c0_g1~~TRINITY_DN3352_c0_g1_i1.p1  ORF type:complete len:268 (-),score=66.32 TRINITY_DN3352_c0_g1_i1:201-1004(-)